MIYLDPYESHQPLKFGILKLFLNCMSTDGSTALHQACGEGNDDAAHLLIHYQADVNIADDRGHTALHWACTTDSTHCLQVISDLIVFILFVYCLQCFGAVGWVGGRATGR